MVHLGERECSIQRRHQKLIEESPSPALTEKMRRKMGSVVIDAAKAVQYTNAGTFEFLMDPDGRFYFMEANTRLQVEHPVTEMVTGIDIVKEQIRIAAGERLGFKQSDVTFTGHSIECRINAEDPETFVPSPGVIHVFSVPGGPGVRVETLAHSECTISPYYDSMIAKIIVHGRDRHGSHRPHAAHARDDRHRGHQDHHPAAPADPERPRLRRRQAEHVVHGALPRAPAGRSGRLAEAGLSVPAASIRVPSCSTSSATPRSCERAGWTLVDFAAACWTAAPRCCRFAPSAPPAGALLEPRPTRSSRRADERGGARVIVNDRADIARAGRRDGVHVGQDDLAPADVRRVIG